MAAARACFFRFGYAKASINDIAKEARISRPLLYLVYRNKEDILRAVFEAAFEPRYKAVERLLDSRETTRQKLVDVYEKLVVEPWEDAFKMPAAPDFFEICQRVLPLTTASYSRRRLRYTQTLLQARERAEVFALAVDGLTKDRPTAALLRKRLTVLVDCFLSAQTPLKK